MSIDKLEPFSGDGYQSRPDFKFSNIYLIKKKVYGWQGDYVWYPHMNRNWFGVTCKELLCP